MAVYHTSFYDRLYHQMFIYSSMFLYHTSLYVTGLHHHLIVWWPCMSQFEMHRLYCQRFIHRSNWLLAYQLTYIYRLKTLTIQGNTKRSKVYCSLLFPLMSIKLKIPKVWNKCMPNYLCKLQLIYCILIYIKDWCTTYWFIILSCHVEHLIKCWVLFLDILNRFHKTTWGFWIRLEITCR